MKHSMILTRVGSRGEPRWVLNGEVLPEGFTLSFFLNMPWEEGISVLDSLPKRRVDTRNLLPPIELEHEVWAAGVTYLRSRNERQAESTVADVYARVYEADRPELFFKALGWRVVGDGAKIRVRGDSSWNVPEPELTLVINRFGETVGYTAGNDVSARSIEGENPLYLPQAKTYDGSCALGANIVLCSVEELSDLPIECVIARRGEEVFRGVARTSQMKRRLPELVDCLYRALTFPHGVFLMTGTGIVPDAPFSLEPGDEVTVVVGEVSLTNEVDEHL